jgi:hypothetical protein
MSSKTASEFRGNQKRINQATIPAETLFHIMLSQNIPKPLDVLYEDLARIYFPSNQMPPRPIRYFTLYRYFEYSDLNYVNSASPYKNTIIEQDNVFPNFQEPEDMVLAAGYRYWLPEFPILDPAKIPEAYRLVFARASNYLIQNIAQRVPYPRTLLPIHIFHKGTDVTERMTDKNSETSIKLRDPDLVVTFEKDARPDEIVILPKGNGTFFSDVIISVLDEDSNDRIVHKNIPSSPSMAENPFSFFLDPLPGRKLTISLKSLKSQDIELSEIVLFHNEYTATGKFYEVRGKIANHSFLDVTNGLPTGWAFETPSDWVAPLVVKNNMDSGFRWLRFENKGTAPLQTFQQVALEKGFYALFFLGYTSGKPSSDCQIEYLQRGETDWRRSSYERLTKPGRGLYFMTFILEKPSLVRINFHQYISQIVFPRKKGVTYLSEVRLFKLK